MFNSVYNDLNTNTNIQANQTTLLKVLSNQGINDYKDKGTFNIGTLSTLNSSHLGTNQFYIQELVGIDEKYNKIMLFGKYKCSNSQATIDMIYSNDQSGGTGPNFTPPTNICFGQSIRGRIRHDTFYHFTFLLHSIPRYTSFFNPNAENITDLQINYIKLI